MSKCQYRIAFHATTNTHNGITGVIDMWLGSSGIKPGDEKNIRERIFVHLKEKYPPEFEFVEIVVLAWSKYETPETS